MINELDDRLSAIKRWSILRTINKQSVAEHCFNVERICMKLAPLFNMDMNVANLIELSQAALHHDDEEALTGDIPATAKPYISIEKSLDINGRMWYTNASDHIKSIVKLADLMEMFHFLTLESHMGNKYVRDHRIAMKRQIFQLINHHPHWPKAVLESCTKWMAFTELQMSQRYERPDDGTTRRTAEGPGSGQQ